MAPIDSVYSPASDSWIGGFGFQMLIVVVVASTGLILAACACCDSPERKPSDDQATTDFEMGEKPVSPPRNETDNIATGSAFGKPLEVVPQAAPMVSSVKVVSEETPPPHRPFRPRHRVEPRREPDQPRSEPEPRRESEPRPRSEPRQKPQHKPRHAPVLTRVDRKIVEKPPPKIVEKVPSTLKIAKKTLQIGGQSKMQKRERDMSEDTVRRYQTLALADSKVFDMPVINLKAEKPKDKAVVPSLARKTIVSTFEKGDAFGKSAKPAVTLKSAIKVAEVQKSEVPKQVSGYREIDESDEQYDRYKTLFAADSAVFDST